MRNDDSQSRTRSRIRRWSTALLLGSLPCSAAAADPLYIVRFIGAEVGPAQSSTQPWDGPPSAATKKAMGVAARVAVSTQPGGVLIGPAVSKVTEELTGLAIPVLNLPDPQGRVTIQVDGEDRESKKLKKKSDTFSPEWGGVVFRNVDIRHATLRLKLSEWDALRDDSIGVCEARSKSLTKAAAADGVALIFCGDQTGNKILFMKVSVQKQGTEADGEGAEHPE